MRVAEQVCAYVPVVVARVVCMCVTLVKLSYMSSSFKLFSEVFYRWPYSFTESDCRFPLQKFSCFRDVRLPARWIIRRKPAVGNFVSSIVDVEERVCECVAYGP